MSYIERLIQQKCPSGVIFASLGDVAELKRGGVITKNEANSEGDIPVIAGGRSAAYYHDKSNRSGPVIVIAGSGAYAGFVSWWPKPVWVSDAFTVKPNKGDLLDKFVFYFLLANQDLIHSLKSGGGVPHVYPKDAAKLQIPIPPLDVQREIVQVLDKFALLEAELEAELAARKQQYEYYRNSLLTFRQGGVRWVQMAELGEFIRGNGMQKSDLLDVGIPAIHYGQLHTIYGLSTRVTKSYVSPSFSKKLRKAKPGNLIIVTTSEDDEAVGKALSWLGTSEVCVSGDAIIFDHTLHPNYVAHFFQTHSFHNSKRKYITGTKVRRINQYGLGKIEIPVPAWEEQVRIASILDGFEDLINDSFFGLSAELIARRQQFDYYRNKLLKFREFEAV